MYKLHTPMSGENVIIWNVNENKTLILNTNTVDPITFADVKFCEFHELVSICKI